MTVISDKQVALLIDPNQHLARVPLPQRLAGQLEDLQRRAGLMHNEPSGTPPIVNAVTVEELTGFFREAQALPLEIGAQSVVGYFIEQLGLDTRGNDKGGKPPVPRR